MDIASYIYQIIATAVVLLLIPLSKLAVRKITRKYGELAGITKARIRQTRYVISVIINITFIFIVAVIWGVKPQNLMLWLSSAFVFVGVALFAQWSMLSNITAGIIMFFSAPYHAGNIITIMDKDMPITATIEIIGTFYTRIRTDDDQLVVIPNNLFLQKIVSVKKNRTRK